MSVTISLHKLCAALVLLSQRCAARYYRCFSLKCIDFLVFAQSIVAQAAQRTLVVAGIIIANVVSNAQRMCEPVRKH